MPNSQFTEAYSAFLTVLVSARKDRGLTQVDVGEALGKPQTFVSKVESGVRRLDVIELIAWAHALGVDPGQLFDAIVSNIPDDIQI